jgi:arsenite-transporting ATPase
VDLIEHPTRLPFFTGKGGVGKTTAAAAIAVELASRGHDVHLTTTDPAAHLSMTLEAALPEALASHLFVDRIDPEAERDRYREHVLATNGAGLDEHARALLEEDLRSPCTEEDVTRAVVVVGPASGRGALP